MADTNDAPQGGESLSIDEAAKAFVTSQQQKEPEGQPDADVEDDGTTTDDELQASDEGVSEDDDGETETEGQDETEDGEEPESDQGRFVASNGKVRLPDGTVSTVADLIQGNLRDRDYRQKTMEAAEVKKTFSAQSEAIKQREAQLNQQAEYVTSLIKSIVPAQPERPDPALADPNSPKFDIVTYLAKQAAYDQWAQWGAHLSYLEQQQQQAKQAGSAEAEKKQRETADREWNALLEKVPAFRDQKRTEAFVNDSLKFGTETYGFTKDELRQALGLDHRQVLVLKDAISWRKLQASKTNVQKKVEGRPPIQKGGKRLNPAEHRSRSTNDALSRLKQSGSVEDATAAYIASLNKG